MITWTLSTKSHHKPLLDSRSNELDEQTPKEYFQEIVSPLPPLFIIQIVLFFLKKFFIFISIYLEYMITFIFESWYMYITFLRSFEDLFIPSPSPIPP